MNQILHIFKKDTRRHWPEILISLALLALYTYRQIHPWQDWSALEGVSISPFFWLLAGQYTGPALIIFWIFLVIRVVHGESLVGDRQWWTTKPYAWWQLLLAKLFFLAVFICVPLFHVQLFLLHRFQFPVLSNLFPLGKMQLSLFALLVGFCVLLASLTKNLVQLLLVVGAAFLVTMAAAAWATRDSSSSTMSETPAVVDFFLDCLLWGTLGGAVAWQFARRRRWIAVAALLLCGVFAMSVSALFTSTKVVERRYAFVDLSSAPVHILFKPIEPTNEEKDFSRNPSKNVGLRIPVTVSGVALGTLVQLNGANVHSESAQQSSWSRGWLNESATFWPEDQENILNYEVDRKEFEKIKNQPLHLRVELALSEYRTVDSRQLQIRSDRFRNEMLGMCRLFSFDLSQLHCLYPIHTPAYVVRFDPEKSGCSDDNDSTAQADTVSYAWESPSHAGFPEPELNPISDYHLWFQSVSLLAASRKEPSKSRSVRLCPGTDLTLSRPVLQRQVRIQLDLPNTRLEDLAVAPLRFRFR